MMMIKVVALDVYGTILAFDDYDDCFLPRQGLEWLFDECDKRGIKAVTSSNALTGNVRNELTITFRHAQEMQLATTSRHEKGLVLERFDGFFQMNQGPKDYSIIIEHYGISPKELLVVGNNPDEDILGALISGANAILCPTYGVDQGREWNFKMVDLDAF